MLVGRDAEMSLRSARIIARFKDLESRGVVRISSEEEQESYFSVYGEPDTEKERNSILDTIERLGCVYVLTEWFDGEEWNHADSIGMCIYEDPESPFENCYVADLMSSAIEQIDAHWSVPSGDNADTLEHIET